MKKTLQTIKKAGIYSAFFGVSLMSAQTTFNYTGGSQTFIAPSTGPYKFETWGAQGGATSYSGSSAVGGMGGYATGTYNLTAGQTINIYVGGLGFEDAVGGYNGGGTALGNTYGGSGGGATDIRVLGTALANRVIVGGGGGGAAGGSHVQTGGAGGGLVGTDGGSSGSFVGGFGGSQVAGGAGGTGYGISQAGSLGQGGGVSDYHNPGGGGGYYGGGSGCVIGGGGGSSYIGGVIGGTTTSGIRSGNGMAVITLLYFVNISQTATISCNGNTTAALSTTVSGGVGPYTYTWAPTGGNAATASALAAGVYTCFVKDAGALLTSSTFTVTQPAVLATSVLSQTNVTCNAGTNGALTVTVTGGTTPYSYTWSPSGGSTASATGLVANNYTCVVRDANLCPIAQTTGTITQPASFSITATVTNSLICGAGSTTLTASGASTYTWTGGVTNGATFTPTVSNSYTVTAKNGSGCLASNSPVLTVNVGSIPTVSVTSGAICSGQSFTMVASGASTYNYTGGSAVVTPTANMSYSVTGTSSVGCVSSNTAISTVTVNANPTISASASSAVICAGEATTLSATASSTTYTWNTGVTTASLSVSPTTTTNYTVNTSDANGCTAKANVNVTVNACTGINEVTASLISVYPNPNNGIVNITLTAALAQNSTLEIYDALGKLVVKQFLANELNAVNMSNLDNGIYVFKVLNNNNTVKIGKLIKQ